MDARHALSLVVLLGCAGCGSDGDDGAPDGNGGGGADRAGCDGATFLATPTDAAARGPWDVGARTVQVGRLTVEVWYPAPPGASAGVDPVVYDLRQQLGASMQDDIPDDDNPWQPCDCHRDLPLDEAHGPYPVIVFVHGTAAFRHQSITHATHWASRGFVVVAADHPGLSLGDLLAQFCPDEPSGAQDLAGDLDLLFAAIAAPADGLAFLAGRIDATRIAVTGHSAGGSAAAQAAGRDGVRVVIPMAANAAVDAPVDQALFLGGMADTIARWSSVSDAYAGSTAPRALVGITNTGHLFCSDLCETKNAEGQNLLEIAEEHQLCGAEFAGFLFDCQETYLEATVGWSIVNDATSTVLESTLQCREDLPDLAAIATRYPDVGHFEAAAGQ